MEDENVELAGTAIEEDRYYVAPSSVVSRGTGDSLAVVKCVFSLFERSLLLLALLLLVSAVGCQSDRGA